MANEKKEFSVTVKIDQKIFDMVATNLYHDMIWDYNNEELDAAGIDNLYTWVNTFPQDPKFQECVLNYIEDYVIDLSRNIMPNVSDMTDKDGYEPLRKFIERIEANQNLQQNLELRQKIKDLELKGYTVTAPSKKKTKKK